jgi:hypothetical protein
LKIKSYAEHDICVEVIEEKIKNNFQGLVYVFLYALKEEGKELIDIKYARTNNLYSAMIIYRTPSI